MTNGKHHKKSEDKEKRKIEVFVLLSPSKQIPGLVIITFLPISVCICPHSFQIKEGHSGYFTALCCLLNSVSLLNSLKESVLSTQTMAHKQAVIHQRSLIRKKSWFL
jgi:hypothetical protein